MISLTTRDFSNIRHKEGVVFFNQNTGRLDTRGGNFLSRIVTWAKSKYNPSKINQEYQMAADSFVTELKRTHNEIFQKYDPKYEINNKNLGRLYQLDTPGRSLAMRRVRQVLARLETVPAALEIANKHSNVQYCRNQLMIETSQHPQYYGSYIPDQGEIEHLSGQIRDAIVDEIYQQEGLLTEAMAASIARKTIKTYAQSKTLKIAINQSAWEDCKAELNKEISKHPDLYKNCELHATDIDELSSRVKKAIIAESAQQGKDITEAEATLIRGEIIRESADTIIETLSKQKALYQEAIQEREQRNATLKDLKKTTKQVVSPPLERAQPIETAKYEHAQIQTAAEVTTKQREIPELPQILRQQLSSREIDSKEKLIQASNRYIAGKIVRHPVRRWYVDSYKKMMGENPKKIPDDLINNIQEHIQSMPTLLTQQQAEAYMKQTVIDYINSTYKH